MAKLLLRIAVLLLACCVISNARPMAPTAVSAATPSPKAMPVPCYLKIFNGFCFTSNDKGACTFYANPSFPTFKQCSEDPNMGKTVKCADVNSDLKDRYADYYKNCVDKEVLQGSSSSSGSSSGSSGSSSSSGGVSSSWSQMDNMDVAGKDIASGDKSFTQVCQGLDQVKQACAKTSGCMGFTFNGQCGYLKTAVRETKGRSGWTVFAIQK